MSVEEAIFRMIQFAMINWVAVIAAAVAAFAAGMVWYSPAMFGKKWMKMMGITEKEMAKQKDKMMGVMVKSLILAAISALVLAHLLIALNITTLFSAVQLAFWIWLGFYATSTYMGVLYEKKNVDWWIITSGHYLVATIASAIVLVLM